MQAKKTLIDFIRYTKDDYQVADHHLKLTIVLDNFLNGKTKKKLMVFAPPQHGKSEIVSRRFPAYALGKNPNYKIAGCSYSSSLASSFNRDVQRIIDDESYSKIFPDTYLNSSSVRDSSKGGKLRNSDIFETIGHNGFYKSVGIGGSLTGTPVDIGIIDDPIKDRKEANSETYRKNVWDWYTEVFSTRLHNDSLQLITLTRWHEDDLAGRLLKSEPDEWDVVIFPAIDENENALWPERHSLERLQAVREKFPTTFEALYQQNPTKAEGNIVKRDWFGTFRMRDIPDHVKRKATLDLAYTSQEENDPSGLMAYIPYNKNLYVFDYVDVRLGMVELLEYTEDFFDKNEISIGYIENKGPGKSAVQMLRKRLAFGRNVKEYKVQGIDKVARLHQCLPDIEGGRVFLLQDAPWTETFLQSVCAFPKAKHDEAVDCLTSMIIQEGTSLSGLISKNR